VDAQARVLGEVDVVAADGQQDEIGGGLERVQLRRLVLERLPQVVDRGAAARHMAHQKIGRLN
jgi:hypothetical protein